MATKKAEKGLNLLKKLSAKTIMEGKVEVPTKQTDLFTVYGIADGVKVGQSNFGEWVALTGQFIAVRDSDQAEFTAPVLFLPEPAQSMATGSLRRVQESDPNASIKIALKIGVKANKAATVGYEYTVKPLVDTKNDQLADLRKEILPALSAPGK